MVPLFRRCTTCLFALLLPSMASAIPAGFADLGDRTLDQATGLEWLDVTFTEGMSFYDVQQDIANPGGLLAPDEGWRYAMVDDFTAMISRWFDINYSGGQYSEPPFGSGDNEIVETFIETFGDVLLTILEENPDLEAIEGGAGRTTGYLGDIDNPGEPRQFNFFGSVSDTEVFDTTTQSRFDVDDFVNANVSGTPSSYARLGLGSWIVRDTVHQVEEPPAWAIAALVIVVLMVRLFRDKPPRQGSK